MNNYMEILSENILYLRKSKNLTQEGLADILGISFQAVSKWENCQSSPDIFLLPKIAEIFGVSIDALFRKESNLTSVSSLPWDDDEVLRGVVFLGQKLLDCMDDLSQFTFKYDGDAMNVESHCNIKCELIQGNAKAMCDINCGDTTQSNGACAIGGQAVAGCDINCGSISGNASAGCDINCGNITGNITLAQEVNCGIISGNITCNSGDVSCNTIEGDVSCSGDVSCQAISGDVQCSGDIYYK